MTDTVLSPQVAQQPVVPPTNDPQQQLLARKRLLEEQKEKNQQLLQKLDTMAQHTKQQQNSPLEQEVTDVEKDLLYQIISYIRESKLTIEQGQELAKEFLALLPFQDKKDLLDKLQKLGENNIATKELYLKYATPYFEEERNKKLHAMSELLKTGKIEDAIAVAKGGTT